jgi:hypothetical protein
MVFRRGRGRLIGEVIVADDTVARAEREQEFRVRRTDGDDALGSLGDAVILRWSVWFGALPPGSMLNPQLAAKRSTKSSAKRRVISGSPFLAKVCWPRAEDQATRVRPIGRYGGGTLPESHRLRW